MWPQAVAAREGGRERRGAPCLSGTSDGATTAAAERAATLLEPGPHGSSLSCLRVPNQFETFPSHGHCDFGEEPEATQCCWVAMPAFRWQALSSSRHRMSNHTSETLTEEDFRDCFGKQVEGGVYRTEGQRLF